MTERQAMVRAAREGAAKFDYLPALVYADWLEEHGEERRAAVYRLWADPESYPEVPDRLRYVERLETDPWFTGYAPTTPPAVYDECHRRYWGVRLSEMKYFLVIRELWPESTSPAGWHLEGAE